MSDLKNASKLSKGTSVGVKETTAKQLYLLKYTLGLRNADETVTYLLKEHQEHQKCGQTPVPNREVFPKK